MKCGVLKSILDNLSNCLMNLKNSGSTGFEPMTSAILSRENMSPTNCVETRVDLYRANLYKLVHYCSMSHLNTGSRQHLPWDSRSDTEFTLLSWRGSYLHLISKHRTSYNTSFILHSFHGKTWVVSNSASLTRDSWISARSCWKKHVRFATTW